MRSTCSFKSSSPSCTAISNGMSKTCHTACQRSSTVTILQPIIFQEAPQLAHPYLHSSYWSCLRLQWLHKPHRPLQQAQHLHHPRSRRTRTPDFPLPNQRLLGGSTAQSTIDGIQCEEVSSRAIGDEAHVLICVRIYENQHLLDATEIFRKLNVHKKVRDWSPYPLISYTWKLDQSASMDIECRGAIADQPFLNLGIVHQARFPLNLVLLLSVLVCLTWMSSGTFPMLIWLQHDRRPY